MISKADFPKLNNPDNAMEVTDPKTGETGYRVGLEVFHQLHCLNLLRMSTYPEYYTKLWWSDTNDKPERVRAHLGTPPPSAFSLPLLMLTRSLHRDPAHEPHVFLRRQRVYVSPARRQDGLLARLREQAHVPQL
jgi:hypothetical protein